MEVDLQRRRLLAAGLAGGAGVVLPGCTSRPEREAQEAEGVSAVEDLMREHGVIRRILVAYAETAGRLLRGEGATVDASAVSDAAALFRQFGEDYHERALEEEHLFPALRRTGGEAGALVDTLLAQHQRGRSITDYVLAATRGGAIGGGNARPLAEALQSLVRMYEAHAAWEDTVVFPAWKQSLAPDRLRELAERFEELEHQHFGEDGFDAAVGQVRLIEWRLRVARLADFTAPAPPALR
jgi:hemerythrin-like domain-containing protein